MLELLNQLSDYYSLEETEQLELNERLKKELYDAFSRASGVPKGHEESLKTFLNDIVYYETRDMEFGKEWYEDNDEKWLYLKLKTQLYLELYNEHFRTLLFVEDVKEHLTDAWVLEQITKPEYLEWKTQTYGFFNLTVNDEGIVSIDVDEPKGDIKCNTTGATSMSMSMGNSTFEIQTVEPTRDRSKDPRVFYIDPTDDELLKDGWIGNDDDPNQSLVHYLTWSRKGEIEEYLNKIVESIIESPETFNIFKIIDIHKARMGFNRLLLTSFQPGVIQVNKALIDSLNEALSIRSKGEVQFTYSEIDLQDPFYIFKKAIELKLEGDSIRSTSACFPHGFTMTAR